MYVELMKNFRRFDRLFAIWLICLLSPKTFDSYFIDIMYVIHEKISSGRFERTDGCKTHFGLLSPKTFDSYYLDMMYVEIIKKIFLVDSSELMRVRLISASWAQKRLIPAI